MSMCSFIKEREDENGKKCYDFSLTLSEKENEVISKVISDKQIDVINAAIEEFLDFLRNPKKFSKFSSFQEYRLFLLIKNVFREEFVSESQVKKIFKIDSAPAQTMINHIKIDYEEELADFNKQSMKSFLESEITKKDDESFTCVCKSKTMIDSLNLLLKNINPNSKKICKVKGTLCNYTIYTDEYELLIEELNK